jgi:hypothetical protein
MTVGFTNEYSNPPTDWSIIEPDRQWTAARPGSQEARPFVVFQFASVMRRELRDGVMRLAASWARPLMPVPRLRL